MFLSCRVPTSKYQKVVKHGGHIIILVCLWIGLGSTCIYFYGSLIAIKSLRTTDNIKAIMEVYGKNIYRSGPWFPGYLGCYVYGLS